jgi:hypothetical protein
MSGINFLSFPRWKGMSKSTATSPIRSESMMRRGAQRLVPALLVILGVTLLPTVRAGMAPTQVAQARPAQPDSHFGRLPLAFEANEGQLPGSTRFLARGAGFVLLLQERGATLELPQARGTAHGSFQSGRIGAVTVLPVRGSRHPRMVGLDRLPGIANYFIGRDPRQWHTDIPTFARVRYQDVYPGIDLEYYGRQGTLDYDWIIHPGANPGIVQMEIEQVSAMGIDRAGSLVVQSAGPKLVQRAPIAYQTLHGVRRSVGVRYLLEGGHRFSFQLNGYDRTQLLIIDPSLAYATTLGGSG